MATSNGTGAPARLNPLPGGIPAGNTAPVVPTHAETLLDIAGEIRRWGSVGLFGAADRLEALARELAPDALTGKLHGFDTDEERLWLSLQAMWQLESIMGAIVDATTADRAGDAHQLCKSLAIRGRDLVCATMSALDDSAHKTADLYLTVLGTPRAAEVAAS